MRPPDQLTLEHIHRSQLHLARDRQLSWSSFNQVVCALRFFYRDVLKKDWEVRSIPSQRTGRELPGARRVANGVDGRHPGRV